MDDTLTMTPEGSTAPASETLNEPKLQISSFTLHILAMAFMVLDHAWATVVTGNMWMTCVGRLAYPIFAFMLVEGFFHTHNFKKYLLRLVIAALLSEIPFNLMMGGELLYPYHQNVICTFVMAILLLKLIDTVRNKGKWWLTVPVILVSAVVGYILGYLTMVDYYGTGILTVIAFYVFHGRKWWQMLGQFACLYYINCVMLAGQILDFNIAGHALEFPQQGLALLAFIPIWLYRGKQGPYNKVIQYCFYGFYPVHMLILALIAILFC